MFAEESNIRANIKLLQCDTISQAKEKIFDHMVGDLILTGLLEILALNQKH